MYARNCREHVLPVFQALNCVVIRLCSAERQVNELGTLVDDTLLFQDSSSVPSRYVPHYKQWDPR